ncbi:prohead protease/major capsid protein fusion protein [Gemmatimonas sp.]|uniref:prohead protease/major capsid protein fusion protein n=1 Tax=Gemmatimonas sp. TaxID=1962908 RepID=UPI0025B9ED4C|nr:prohead protease/major capsid protein fusion protein [Gemmatimonas sp.]MCA2992100.1 HK97 family phage prohead protease [Gemmatimonas sp.]
MPPDTLLLPVIGRAASVRPESINPEARTVEIVWTTGATVQRRRWEGWDEIREYDEELIVTPAAVRLERMNGGAPFLDSHDGWSLRSVLGAVEPGSVRIEGGQGVATIRLTSAPDAADTVHRILEKTVRHVSVGYRVHRYEITKREGQRELWRAVDWEPMEVSAVAMPADPGAHIRAAGAGPNPAGAALAPCTLTRSDTPAANAAHHKEAVMPNDTPLPGSEPDATRSLPPSPAPVVPAPPAPSADTIRAEERQRAAEITTLCQRHGLGLDFGADLIARGVALDAARAAILDRLVAQNPTTRGAEITPARVGGPSSTDLGFRDAVTEALLHRHEPGRTPLSTDAREFRGLTLMEMARIAVERRGINTRGMSKMELASEALMGRASVGYHATADFPFLLANVANKTLRSAYESTPRTFTAWARQATITDFKQVQRTQLGGAPDLQRVPESGEFTYGTIGEGREVYSLLTYGRIVGITRQTLINDDLDAFTRVPSAFGASAADLESDLVYSILTTNPLMGDGLALFVAGHGNLGTAAAITEASLAEAYRLFGNQRGLEGRQISIQPRYILTPPGTRSVEARKNVTATTPSAVAGVNAFAGRLEPIEEPRLIPAAGADPWFLVADPSRIDTVEYGYLEGNTGPYTETRTGFEVDGIEIKARHDFATKAIDWRGMLRNAGI